MAKVSIVVPVYNVEPYLRRCLDSLLTQTLADIEIVAVNDGSTDLSGAILAEYARRDSRVVVIEKANGGVSSARNLGVRMARGEFIGFTDPDDWIDPDMYAQMAETAEDEEADIVMCAYVREFGTHAKVKKFDLPEKLRYEGDEIRDVLVRRLIGPVEGEMANPEYLDAWGTVWSKLYRSRLLKENRLAFVDLRLIGTNEDSLFNIHAFYHAQTFVLLNKPYYHYWRANADSVTSAYKPDLQDRWLNLYGIMERFIRENRLPEEFLRALDNRICLGTLGLGLNAISPGNKAPVYKKLKKLSRILNDGRVRSSFRQFRMDGFSMVWKLFYTFAKVRFVPGYYLLLLAINVLRKTVRQPISYQGRTQEKGVAAWVHR